MSIADWIILAFLVLSVAGAAIEGFFHEATGLFLFFAAFVVLILLHQLLVRIAKFYESRRSAV